jgi:hypothetical protein
MSKNQDQTFNCPNCGQQIEISEILANRIRKEVERDFDNEKKKIQELAVKDAELRLERKASENKAKLTLELADLKEQLAEKNKVAEAAREHELALRKKSRELEQKQQAENWNRSSRTQNWNFSVNLMKARS